MENFGIKNEDFGQENKEIKDENIENAISNAIDTLIESVGSLDYKKDYEVIKQKVIETLNQCEEFANEESDSRDLWANFAMARAYTKLSKIFPEFKEHSCSAIDDLQQTIFSFHFDQTLENDWLKKIEDLKK